MSEAIHPVEVILPDQTCPEHRASDKNRDPGNSGLAIQPGPPRVLGSVRTYARDNERIGGPLQPFFPGEALSRELRRRLTATERRKWQHFFADHGCLICEGREGGHGGYGMCRTCYQRVLSKLQATRKRHAPKARAIPELDTVRLAREALLPSIQFLRRGEE